MSEQTICLESRAFYLLLDEVVKHIDEKLDDIGREPWINTEKAMEILDIKSKTTLLQLRAEGKIRYTQPQHKIILYDRQSLLDHLEKFAQNTF